MEIDSGKEKKEGKINREKTGEILQPGPVSISPSPEMKSKLPDTKWEDMPKVALITGITGQDGSYLAEFLLRKGYEVHDITSHSRSCHGDK